MIYSYEDINKFCSECFTQSVLKDQSKEFIIFGSLSVNGSVKGYQVLKEYQVELHIPKDSNELPYVIDIQKAIDREYQHIYKDGRLCLATDMEMRLLFREDSSLSRWLQNFVIPFYITYEYYERYGEYPFGDRDHGCMGIIQSYSDIWKVSYSEAEKMVNYIANYTYRGHMLCPCGSHKRIRECHGTDFLKIYNDAELYQQLIADYKSIYREVYHGLSR